MKKTNTLTKLTVIAAAGVVTSPLTTLNVKADTVESSNNTVETRTQTIPVKEHTPEELKSKIVSAETTSSQAKLTYDNIANQIVKVEAELSESTRKDDQIKEAIVSTDNQLTIAQNELPEAEKALEKAQNLYDKVSSENPTIAAELKRAEAEQATAEKIQAQSETQLEKTTKEKEIATQALSTTKAQIKTAEANITIAQKELVHAKDAVSASEASLVEAKDNLAKTQETILTKTAELEVAVANAGQDTIVSTRNVQVASIDGSQQVEKSKSANHEQLLYSGTKIVEKELTPNQLQEYKEKGYFTYTPDAKAVSQYMVTLLRELRALNGIDIPVPEVSAEALDYAQKRVDEILANRVLSHDTKYDQTYQNSENAGIINYAKTSNSSNGILSDEQLAYHLLNTYFADYENLYVGYGHRIALLTASGDGLGNAFAGRYHTMEFMDYSGVTSTVAHSRKYWEVMQGFTYDSDTENTMYFNGKRLTFLPRTTFTYITKVTEATPNTNKATSEKALSDYKLTAQSLLTAARNNVKKAETAVTSAKASQATVEARLANLNLQLNSLVEDLETAKVKLQAVEKAEVELNEKVTLAKLDTRSKAIALDTLATQAAALVVAKDRVEAEEKKVASLKGKISDLESKLNQLKSDNNKAQVNITELTSSLADLLPQKEVAKANQEKANVELTRLKNQLAALKAKAILTTVPTSTSHQDKVKQSPIIKPLSSIYSSKDSKFNIQKTPLATKGTLSAVTNQTEAKEVSTLKPLASTSSTHLIKNPVTATKSISNSDKLLPSTGESSNIFIMGLGLILSVAGIVGLYKKAD